MAWVPSAQDPAGDHAPEGRRGDRLRARLLPPSAILLATTYDAGGSNWFTAPAAVAVITAGGVFYAWVWDRARTVWPVAIAHNVVNVVFDLGAAALVAAPGWNLTYVAGETGALTLVACLALAATLLRRARVWHEHRRTTPPTQAPLPQSATTDGVTA